MFQKWSLSKCTSRSTPVIATASSTLIRLFLGMTLSVSLTCFAVPARKKPPQLPPLLVEVETKYTRASTLTAEFSQVTEDAILQKKKISSGKIFIKRPSRVRWETLLPDKNLLVSDGQHFWYYTPPFDEGERGQVIEKKSSNVQSRLANSLLSGAFSMNRDMIIRQKTPSQFLLTPKAGSAGTVQQALVEIDPEKKIIQKVTLNHRGGNRAEISLSKVELGADLKDTLFTFQPPPNTDKLDDFSGK